MATFPSFPFLPIVARTLPWVFEWLTLSRFPFFTDQMTEGKPVKRDSKQETAAMNAPARIHVPS